MLSIEDYIKRLKLNAIIFDDDIMDEVEYPEAREYIFSLEFLKILNFKTSVNVLTEEFDFHVIDNIREVLNYIRFNGVDKNYFPIINQVLSSLNIANSKGCSTFYKIQYLKRKGLLDRNHLEKRDLSLYTEQKNKQLLENIRAHISLDYDILTTLLYDNDETFKTNIKEYTLEHFLSTINLVMYECEAVLELPLFRKRVKYVLNHARQLEGKLSIASMLDAGKTLIKLKK